jgi:hypothetical protein
MGVSKLVAGVESTSKQECEDNEAQKIVLLQDTKVEGKDKQVHRRPNHGI